MQAVSDVLKKRGMHAATQGGKTFKLPIATQVEPGTRTGGQEERALSASCGRKSYVSVANWLRAEELHPSCKLFARGKIAFCLRLGCVRKICKLRAYGRAACSSRFGCVREIYELFACGRPAKLRVGCLRESCR